MRLALLIGCSLVLWHLLKSYAPHRVKQTIYADLSTTQRLGNIEVDAHGRHIGYVVRDNDTWTVCRDGKTLYSTKYKPFSFDWSANLLHFGLIEKRRDNSCFIVNGEHLITAPTGNDSLSFPVQYDAIILDTLPERTVNPLMPHRTAKPGERIIFSPDGKHETLLAPDPKTRMTTVTIDGKAQSPVEKHIFTIFSDDGAYFAYVGMVDGKVHIFPNGRMDPLAWQSIKWDEIVFRRDGALTYVGRRDNKEYVVLEGKVITSGHDHVSQLQFHPKNDRLIYVCTYYKTDTFYTYTEKNGKTVRTPVKTLRADESYIRWDEYNGPFNAVGEARVDAQWDTITFPVVDKYNKLCLKGSHDDTSTKYQVNSPSAMHNVTVSDNGKHYWFYMKKNDMDGIVLNGKFFPTYPKEWMEDPIFSPKGRHLAYVARDYSSEKTPAKERGIFALVILHNIRSAEDNPINNHEEQRFDSISKLVFSPDSRHIAYYAQNRVYVDGVALAGTELVHGPIVFDSPTTLHWFATRDQHADNYGGKLVRVDATLTDTFTSTCMDAVEPVKNTFSFEVEFELPK